MNISALISVTKKRNKQNSFVLSVQPETFGMPADNGTIYVQLSSIDFTGLFYFAYNAKIYTYSRSKPIESIVSSLELFCDKLTYSQVVDLNSSVNVLIKYPKNQSLIEFFTSKMIEIGIDNDLLKRFVSNIS